MLSPVGTEIQIAHAEALVFRAQAEPAVRTSFGTMQERPALLIRLIDRDGIVGWGEAWCNFPAVGAEHRARLLSSVFAPLLEGTNWPSPTALFESLTARTEILGIQAGEPGPLAQVISAIDIAAWDIAGKRAHLPLWKLFGGTREVAVYASGINPDHPLKVVLEKEQEGYRAFKLKIGFDDELDEHNIKVLRKHLGPGGTLMVDANQAWDLDHAQKMLHRLEPYDLLWVEEPVRADTSCTDWRQLTSNTSISLAAGENLRGEAAFKQALQDTGIQIIQPDPGKWGGFSGCLPVGRTARSHGRWFCPHWLGASIGLRAAMHLKAAIGGEGYVEVDANPNPLRDLLGAPGFIVRNGCVTLPDTPGLGIEPQLDAAQPYLVQRTRE